MTLIAATTRRPPDIVIGDPAAPYLRRWWLVPRNPWANVYLHQFLSDDDDRALHDHPWPWVSIILRGEYLEHTIAAGGIHRVRRYGPGTVRAHGPGYAHRLALPPGQSEVWTLFLTGPRVRHWGFHCPHAGWVHWRDFTDASGLRAGRGCGEG